MMDNARWSAIAEIMDEAGWELTFARISRALDVALKAEAGRQITEADRMKCAKLAALLGIVYFGTFAFADDEWAQATAAFLAIHGRVPKWLARGVEIEGLEI